MMERLRAGEIGPEDRGYSLRPLAAGEEDIVRVTLGPGAYAMGCRRETEAGTPHTSLGELAPFRVEDDS